MKQHAFALLLGLLPLACGSRAGLSALDAAPDRGSIAEPGPVSFPSIEETAAVPEPAPAPELRPREDGRGNDLHECGLAVPSLDTVLARMQADVLAQPAADRPFLRYVSAAFSLPFSCRPDTAVNALADGLPLLLNSLSLTQKAASARPLPGEEMLLRIDLREMGWDRPLRVGGRMHADGWEALAASAGQSVALRGPEADALSAELGTGTPFLHGHDFASAALAAGVYYALLDAPQTLEELRRALGIPPELDAEPNAYWRAVTTESVVSRQDRVVLRYRGPAGSPLFWRTLDLGPEAAADSAFVDPLARAADESSVVYTLPNGLPAYFLAAADGHRLDESHVLFDTSEDDFVPRTAPSCVRCHSDAGVLPVVDELRAYAATDPNGRFGARERALLAEVYPSQKDLDALIDADRRRVKDARARLGVSRDAQDGLNNDLILQYAQDLEPLRAAAELCPDRCACSTAWAASAARASIKPTAKRCACCRAPGEISPSTAPELTRVWPRCACETAQGAHAGAARRRRAASPFPAYCQAERDGELVLAASHLLQPKQFTNPSLSGLVANRCRPSLEWSR